MKSIVVLVLALSLSAFTALAGTRTGHISDAKCGKAHANGTEKSAACVKACVNSGTDMVFVTGDEVIKVANKDKVDESMYAQKVTVTGEVNDGVLTIATIQKAD
jgi:hypothetical protein